MGYVDADRLVNRIVHGDNLSLMKAMPDNSVDMFFADPPFNLNKNYGVYQDKQTDDTYMGWCKKWLYEAVRITKPTGSIFIHNIPKWLIPYANYLNQYAYFRHWIVWSVSSRPAGSTLIPWHYGILYYTKAKSKNEYKFYPLRRPHDHCRKCKKPLADYGGKPMHELGPLLSDVWSDIQRVRTPLERKKLHPCQLPELLLERLILMSTDKGDIVFDPFMGTGTTAVAAKRLGRKYMGVDIDPDYVTIANDRLKAMDQEEVSHNHISVDKKQIIRTARHEIYKGV